MSSRACNATIATRFSESELKAEISRLLAQHEIRPEILMLPASGNARRVKFDEVHTYRIWQGARTGKIRYDFAYEILGDCK